MSSGKGTAMGGTGIGGVFDAGAREFDAWGARLWDPIGEATVGACSPKGGERVLDACCGAGASALPAAAAVAPDGTVDAVDLSEALLAQGRERAARAGIDNVRFVRADAAAWPEPGAYDLVQVVHGVAFFPDMDAGTAALAGALRPGGRMAVTVWAEGALADFLTLYFEAIGAETGTRPGPPGFQQARDRIADAARLTAWLEGLGLVCEHVARHDHRVPLDAASAWEFVQGNAARGLMDGLDAPARERVRTRLADLMAERGVAELDASFTVALARRPD
ncbi:methyltransferase domain-containing protein [Nocardiopsis halophila]|uniref:methyltransferase domain-containing protein n=1 Tax=Nocardiopsis halophila TaxID=141692 RepID=UPI00036C6C6D|nr:methyltransferase domain-containing protein [Nocardiopsis halophila]